MLKTETTEKPPLYNSDITRITNMISRLEGQSFGKWMRLTAIGTFRRELHIDINRGWTPIEGFHTEWHSEAEVIERFVTDFNKATQPVRERFANDLRQLLANKCVKLAADSLGEGTWDERF